MSSESLAQDGHELTTVYPMDVVVVQFEFNAGNKKEKYLSMQPGDTVYVLAKDQSVWWDGLITVAGSPQTLWEAIKLAQLA